MRERLKSVALGIASLLVLPRWLAFLAWSRVVGSDRAFESAMERLARVPGLRGEYLRRAFLMRAIRNCHRSATIRFGTLMSKVDAVIEENVYVGPHCHLGLVHLERDVLLAAGVHVPSGRHGHGSADVKTPIRQQHGHLERVRIGAGTWIGSGAIILADVGRDSIVGAGSVVTHPVPDRVIAAGAPARVIRYRDGSPLHVSSTIT